MSMRIRCIILTGLAALASGCAESQRPEATGEANIRGVHAIVDGPEVAFRIEERSLGSINYKGVTTTEAFDNLSYRFNFDGALPGDTATTRIASRSLDVVADMDYVFVLIGDYNDADVLLWESAEREWESSEEVTEVSAGHLAASAGSVDVGLVAPGAAPVAGDIRGTLAFGERLDNFDVEAGNYQVVLTAVGNPSAVLFRSATQALTERTSVLFTVHDADPSITSTISMRRIGSSGGSAELADIGAPPTRRYLHAASGTGNFDAFVNEDFTTPIAADVAFAGTTADLSVPAGKSTYTYTAAGNTGAVLFEEEPTVVANTRVTSFFVGPPGKLDVVDVVDDRRPIVGTSKVRLVQLTENFENLDIYLRPAGTDINDVIPSFPNVPKLLSTGYARLEPGDYELTVTETGKKAPIAPVLSLDLGARDVAEIAIIDTVDPAKASAVRYD